MRIAPFAVTAMLLSVSVLLQPLTSIAESHIDISIQSSATNSVVIHGEYIVTLKENATLEEIEKKHKIGAVRKYETALRGFSGKLSDDQLQKLKADPAVAMVEPDYVVTTSSHLTPSPTPTPTPSPSPTPTNPQQMPAGINRIEADLNSTADIDGNNEGVNADVAIIDTGIDGSHSDLNVVKSVNFINGGSGNDDNGHGTHVAGTVAAKDDGKGVVGVAPGARLWALKALDSNGSGKMSDIIEAIDYVTEHASEIDVVNMSLGCTCTSNALNTAINYAVAKGVVFAVAAGNNSRDAGDYSPASHPNVIAVSAIADFNGSAGGGASSTCGRDSDDTFADFSNYGSIVDIAAPGVCVNSTNKGGGYKMLSGTSMAAPHVAGAAALFIAKNGKPSTKDGALNVRNTLVSAGFVQNGGGGFSGDPDARKEPLLNVSSL